MRFGADATIAHVISKSIESLHFWYLPW